VVSNFHVQDDVSIQTPKTVKVAKGLFSIRNKKPRWQASGVMKLI
jgi:hypothetical protein